MSTKFLLSVACALTALSAIAVPARRSVFTVNDAAGNERTVRLYGDESFHYYVDEANGELLISRDGLITPADVDASGRLVRAANAVKANARAAALKRAAEAAPRRVPGLYDNVAFPTLGEQKAVVVLVEYQDIKFNLPDPADYFTRLLNEEGFSDYYATGSARDWYLASSAGKFSPQFDVFGPVTLQKSQSYYGGNDAYGQDNAPQKMVIEACRLLNGEVDFSQYDRDNDGYIDNVFVVYAGRGEASGGNPDCVWPHAWTLASAEPGSTYTFDNVRLNRYACCNEWELSDLGHGYRPVGIGTFVHEFTHVMGLPDLYSTSYVAGTFTPGAWDVMDYGPYNNDGCTPPQFSGWQRAALGYLEPKTLPSGAANLALGTLADGDAYLIPTNKENEFFMLENRRQDGWDAYIPGHGMLVWHIDYDADVWRSNTVNNDPNYNHVRLLLADNVEGNATRAGDCFPGTENVTALSATTTPALKTHAGASLGVEISDIKEIHNRIAMRLAGGNADIAAPSGITVTDVEAGYFTVNWQPVPGASGYFVSAVPVDSIKDAQAEYWLDAEVFVPADATSFVIEGLTPASTYQVGVRADDTCYGSVRALAESHITTLEPTLDYFAPTATAATDVTDKGFTAVWQPLTGAKEYFVTVYRQTRGEEASVAEHFDDLNAMQNGFRTNSAVSYGMSSYAGESAPSLRLAKDGDALFIVAPSPLVTALQFWHRGNATSEADTLSVWTRTGADWTRFYAIPAVTEKGGLIINFAQDFKRVDEFKIEFNRNQKGSLAIDDVVMHYIADLPEVALDAYAPASAGNALSLDVKNLEPGATYTYTVYATDGRYTSAVSNKVEITLLDEGAGIKDVNVNITDVRLNGRMLTADTPFDVYGIDGRLLARDVTSSLLPAAGVYIVAQQGNKPLKLVVK